MSRATAKCIGGSPALDLYAGTPDGKFGAQTRDAVRRFQISRGMVPDGYADGSVLEALRRNGVGPATGTGRPRR